MVVAQQSRTKPFTLSLEQPVVGLSISYDGQPKVAQAQHEAEVEAAYKSGYDDASSQYNQQILEFRSEVNAMREETFSKLEAKFRTIVNEARQALMTLTYDCVCRTLGGLEMSPEIVASVVDAIVVESGLDEEKMQVKLNPKDIALLQDLESELVSKHPGLELVPDNALGRGDCVLSSRFGKIDGTLSTKLEKLKGSLRPQ